MKTYVNGVDADVANDVGRRQDLLKLAQKSRSRFIEVAFVRVGLVALLSVVAGLAILLPVGFAIAEHIAAAK